MVENRMVAEPFGLGRSILQACLILLVCLSILAPPIPSGGSFPFVRVEQLSIPILLVLYAWLLMAGLVPMFRFNGMFIIGTLFTFCILLSIWYGAVVLQQNVVLRDFYEIPKLWFPVVFFTMACETKFSRRSLGHLLYAYSFAIMLICLYAWGQWIGLPVTQTLNGYYSAGVHDEALYLTKRVYATMANPNVLGLLLSWAVVCSALTLLSSGRSRIWSAVVLVGSAVTILMTASRYSVLTAATGLIIALFLTLGGSSSPIRNRVLQFAPLGFVLAVLALVSIQVVQSSPHTVTRYEELKHPVQVDSLRERLDDLWIDALADFERSPLLGFGPAKIRFSGIVTDSEYLDVLKQFGLLGFAVYMGFFLYPLFSLWKGVRAAKAIPPYMEPELRVHVLVIRFTFTMMIMVLLINIGAATFYSLFLQGFLWLWFGVGVGSSRAIQKALELVPVTDHGAYGPCAPSQDFDEQRFPSSI